MSQPSPSPPRPTERRIGTPLANRWWPRALVRLGFAVRGIVYVGIGIGGLAVAVGAVEHARGAVGVIRVVSRIPLGEVMLAALATGLAGYAALNIAGAARDPFGYGGGIRGWWMRGADAIAGGVYIALAAVAVRLLAEPGARSGATAGDWAARVLALPFGRAWLIGVGAGVLAAGGFLAFKALDGAFVDRLDRRALSAASRRWIVGAARAGTVARAVIFAVCGASVLGAAWRREPARVVDMADGLDALGGGALGPVILGLVSAGFIAYGLYQFVKARHRRITFG